MVQTDNLLAIPKPARALRNENRGLPEEAPISSVSAALSRASKRTRTASAASKPRPEGNTAAPSAARASTLSNKRTGSTSGPSQSQKGKFSSVSRYDTASKLSEAARRKATRTPSPDLPAIDSGRETPIPAERKGKEKANFPVLGLTSPDVDRQWIRADENLSDEDGDKNGKRVDFAQDEGDNDNHLAQTNRDRRDPEMTMQVSPRRQFATGETESWAAVPSPLRGARVNPVGGSPRPQEFLQSLLRDAMYEFRQETRSELMGLHLDLIRMGQGWKKEIRDAVGEWREELRLLREENARLREENEILRRGY